MLFFFRSFQKTIGRVYRCITSIGNFSALKFTIEREKFRDSVKCVEIKHTYVMSMCTQEINCADNSNNRTINTG